MWASRAVLLRREGLDLLGYYSTSSFTRLLGKRHAHSLCTRQNAHWIIPSHSVALFPSFFSLAYVEVLHVLLAPLTFVVCVVVLSEYLGTLVWLRFVQNRVIWMGFSSQDPQNQCSALTQWSASLTCHNKRMFISHKVNIVYILCPFLLNETCSTLTWLYLYSVSGDSDDIMNKFHLLLPCVVALWKLFSLTLLLWRGLSASV